MNLLFPWWKSRQKIKAAPASLLRWKIPLSHLNSLRSNSRCSYRSIFHLRGRSPAEALTRTLSVLLGWPISVVVLRPCVKHGDSVSLPCLTRYRRKTSCIGYPRGSSVSNKSFQKKYLHLFIVSFCLLIINIYCMKEMKKTCDSRFPGYDIFIHERFLPGSIGK